MSEWHGGKGSRQRKTDKKRFEDNWDRIFGNKEAKDAREEKKAERQVNGG